MTKQLQIEELEKAIIKPIIINDLHSASHKNIVWCLKEIIINRNEALYQSHKESIDSLVESQIDLAQRFKKTENLKYWQWVQRKLMKIQQEGEQSV